MTTTPRDLATERQRHRKIREQHDMTPLDVAQEIFKKWAGRARFDAIVSVNQKNDLIKRIAVAIAVERTKSV